MRFNESASDQARPPMSCGDSASEVDARDGGGGVRDRPLGRENDGDGHSTSSSSRPPPHPGTCRVCRRGTLEPSLGLSRMNDAGVGGGCGVCGRSCWGNGNDVSCAWDGDSAPSPPLPVAGPPVPSPSVSSWPCVCRCSSESTLLDRRCIVSPSED